MARRKKRSDWGSMTEVSPGVWRIRYWAADDEGGYRRRSKTVRGTRKDAGDIMAQLRVDHSEDAPCPTVGQCWERWYLPDMERRVESGELARQSLGQYRSMWNKHIEPRWANVPADQVRPLGVQQWLLSLPYAAAKACIPVMRRTMDYAVRYELIAANPMGNSYVMPPKSTSRSQDDEAWSPDELLDVWRVCHGTPLEPVVLLCGFGSCRVGEALGVHKDDVSMREVEGVPIACVRIDSQIDGSGREDERTKNRWSTRTVVLAGVPALRLAQISAAAEDGAFLATNGIGPLQQHTARKMFAETLAGTGVAAHPLRNLRKTWQTVARWTLRMPPWVTERMMGHVGEGVTGRHYDRPETEEFAETLAIAWRDRPFADVATWALD